MGNTTIDIRTDEIENSINDLKSLKTTIIKESKNPPNVVGGGKTISEIETIGSLYPTMTKHMIELVESTIKYLESIKKSFISTDNSAAKRLG